MDELAGYREEIDRLDEQLLALLGRRFQVCREIGRHKRAHAMATVQPARAADVRRRAVALGASVGLEAHFVSALYDLIMAEACRLQDEASQPQGPRPQSTAR